MSAGAWAWMDGIYHGTVRDLMGRHITQSIKGFSMMMHLFVKLPTMTPHKLLRGGVTKLTQRTIKYWEEFLWG